MYFSQDCKVTDDLDHAFDIRQVFKRDKVETKIRDETCVTSNPFLNRVKLSIDLDATLRVVFPNRSQACNQ